ncbi:ParB domain protein nuclease [Petrocella atlantisensis]|uniref:ParB domain protein nuclease n=1 Tax=Petrocella atlantisensis TaxID=2173034 RepID=A0A3P7SBY4_9FIRM|nr:ParB N-terminal domain-containing protein [Petrocella atlantisensis]VDN49219.1 ParB domain protein nuclease [Petrocella atlantisensis]
MKKNSPRRNIADAIDFLTDDSYEQQITDIEISEVSEFSDHPFHLYEGKRLEDMVESIKKNGVLNPVIVRKLDDGKLEMLSGHNRMNASRIAGLEKVPAVIKSGLTDEEAYIYVIETNLMQRSFNDLHDTEKGAVLKLRHEKISSQGRRSDILRELNAIENGDEFDEESQVIDSRGRLAKEYNLDNRKVARLIRLTYLIEDWKLFVDNTKKAFLIGVNISYLAPEMQTYLYQECDEMGIKLNLKNAEALKKMNADKPLDETAISKFLLSNEKEKIKPKEYQSIKVRAKVFDKYLKDIGSPSDVDVIIEAALKEYFDKRG